MGGGAWREGGTGLNQSRVLVVGAGYSGRAIARKLVGQGAFVIGTNRSAAKAKDGVRAELYAGDGFGVGLKALLPGITHLVVTVAPDERGDPLLNDLRATGLAQFPALKHVCYLSTVGVYGDYHGAWVDETAECRLVSRRSRLRLDAETEWQRLADELGARLTILRLAGIYGPGRNAFVSLKNGTAKRIVKVGQVFNRIHVEDIAGAVSLLFSTDQAGIFNVSDDKPAPPQDVISFAAALMGVEAPAEISYDEAQMTPMGRSFYEDCKRISNERLKQAGYQLLYPDYRQALQDMLRIEGNH